MLRIDLLDTATLRMSGRLAEGCREEVDSFLGSHQALPNLLVDLTEITYINRAGEETLCRLDRQGAKFIADNPYTLHICALLRLRVVQPRTTTHKGHDTRGGRHA